jgi:hypothetical protein
MRALSKMSFLMQHCHHVSISLNDSALCRCKNVVTVAAMLQGGSNKARLTMLQGGSNTVRFAP